MSTKPTIMVVPFNAAGEVSQYVDITHHHTWAEARAHIGRVTGRGYADKLIREEDGKYYTRCSTTGICGHYEIV